MKKKFIHQNLVKKLKKNYTIGVTFYFISIDCRDMKTQKIVNESFQWFIAYYYFSRRILFAIRCESEWQRKKEIIKIIFAFARRYLGINEKAFEKENDILIISKIDGKVTIISTKFYGKSFATSIFKVLNVLIFSRLESLVAWIIRIIIFTCLKTGLGASRSLIHRVIIHNIIASSRAAWN